jgi:hypothetical protein
MTILPIYMVDNSISPIIPPGGHPWDVAHHDVPLPICTSKRVAILGGAIFASNQVLPYRHVDWTPDIHLASS